MRPAVHRIICGLLSIRLLPAPESSRLPPKWLEPQQLRQAKQSLFQKILLLAKWHPIHPHLQISPPKHLQSQQLIKQTKTWLLWVLKQLIHTCLENWIRPNHRWNQRNLNRSVLVLIFCQNQCWNHQWLRKWLWWRFLKSDGNRKLITYHQKYRIFSLLHSNLKLTWSLHFSYFFHIFFILFFN